MPPILHRKLFRRDGSQKRGKPRPSGKVRKAEPGRERGPGWYDETFHGADHWKDEYFKSRYYPTWAVIAYRLSRSGVGSVLDVGCGSGQMAQLLRDKKTPRYLGFDFSPARVEHARSSCPEYEFVVADVFETDLLENHEYDAVVCTEFLEHVERDLEVLDRIRPGTLFLATVPNFPSAAHVRHFASEAEITDRYGSVFEELHVEPFVIGRKTTVLYVIEGVKR